MQDRLYDIIEANPIIASIKSEEDLEACCRMPDIKVVFVLYGDICSLSDIVRRLKAEDKKVVVHIDLILGLGSKEVAVDFIKEHTEADGIISTKPPLLKRAVKLGLDTVLRVFVLDSMALASIDKNLGVVRPGFIEILPGLMPKIISQVCDTSKVPVIAGGLISCKEDAVAALNAGAVAISSTNHSVWNM